jgi:hypothetical protein
MAALSQSRPSLAQALRGARARLDGEALVLEVAADFAGFAGTHLEEYRELAAKAVGRPLKIRVEAGVPAPAEEAPPSPVEVKRQRLMKEAAREPAVQEALDLFDGRIVDVREAKEPS